MTRLLLLSVFTLLTVSTHAGEPAPLFGPKSVTLEAPDFLPLPETGWFIEGFSTGMFPTSANDPIPLDLDGDFSAGGGASIGYRFNDTLAARISGQMVRADGVWFEDIHADLIAYLPRGVDPWRLFPDFVAIPDFNNAQFYLFLGGGVQHSIGGWDSLLRAGAGVEMPITDKLDGVTYFLEGAYTVIGIGTNDDTLEPYPSARTGIRLRF